MSQADEHKSSIVHRDNNSDVLELYKITRTYITHEDSLINNRLTWLLTIQGLLFTAYGLALRETVKSSELVSLIFLLKILGIMTSFLGLTGILAAVFSIREIEQKWQSFKPQNLISSSLVDNLPDITGGGSQVAHILGGFTPISLVSIFFVAWFSLLTLWQYPWLNYLLGGILVLLLLISFGFPFKKQSKRRR